MVSPGSILWALAAEEETAVKTAALPLLREAQISWQPVLRAADGEVPEGELAVLHQRSVIALPLVSQGKVRGLLYGDLRHVFGRFDDRDIDLLSLLANQAAAALENADWTQSLEEKVTQRTAELAASNASLEQRNAELAIINKVQEGLVASMDMETIYGLVGDTIRDIFDAQSVLILLFDHEAEIWSIPYSFEKGVRYYEEPSPFSDFHRYLIGHPEVILVNENALELGANLGLELTPGTEAPKSMVFVPLITGNTVNGFVSLQNIDQENAFSPSDVRLLTTLANSMSVALENVRLFNETQRLLLETEQHAAELAIINSVGEAMSRQLDVITIGSIVGDTVRDIFKSEVLGIYLYNPEIQEIQGIYSYDRGYIALGNLRSWRGINLAGHPKAPAPGHSFAC